jgi:hypothetical protein
VQLAPFISPDGAPVFTAGGRHAWKTFEHRGFVVSLEWTRRRRRTVPTMVIWPATSILRAHGSGSDGMWVVTRDAILNFVGFNTNDRCTGSGTPLLYDEAREALAIMGKDRNDGHAHRALIDTVVRYADDLQQMPPAPVTIRRELQHGTTGPMWELKATNKGSGRVIHEGEV